MHHGHPHRDPLTRRTAVGLGWSLGLTGAFVIVELTAGLWANSLALLTDAAHNFTDVLALGLTWYTFRLADKPAHSGKTYGYHRAGILAALANSTTLAAIALGISYEAFRRFLSPPDVEAPILIGVGAIAFGINLVTAALIRPGSAQDLNLRSAFLHLMGDVLSTLGAVLAGILILLTGMDWLDPLVSVLIAMLILWNAWGIVRQTVQILLESTPENIVVQDVVASILAVRGVRGVHDLHVWSLSEQLRALSAHIVTDDISIREGIPIQDQIQHMLESQYNIQHATLQLECEHCRTGVLFCEIKESHPEA